MSGRVVRKGEPLPLDERLAAAKAAYVQVGFDQLTSDGNSTGFGARAIAEPDGTFQVRSLPPGRYRVSVQYNDGKNDDALRGRFGTSNSPLTLEVGSAAIEGHIIDVGTGR